VPLLAALATVCGAGLAAAALAQTIAAHRDVYERARSCAAALPAVRVGYCIAKDYYRHARDRRAALRPLLELKDAKQILADSGWKPGDRG
jgi:hypothetical protein